MKPKNGPRSVRPSGAAVSAALLLASALLMTVLSGCGGQRVPAETPAPEGSPAAEPVRRDGERFGRRFACLANTLTVIDSRAVEG